MAVTFDAAATGISGAGVTTFAVNITIGSGANRAAACLLLFTVNTVSNVAVTGAGGTWTLVPNTTINANGNLMMIFSAPNPSSGAQTVTVTWTTGSLCVMAVDTVAGADQTTPMIHGGTASHGTQDTSVDSITSAVGNMAVDYQNQNGGVALAVGGGDASQTQVWNANLGNKGSTVAITSGTTANFGWSSSGATDWTHTMADFQVPVTGTTLPIFVQC